MLAKLKVMSCTQWSKSNVDNFKNCHCFGSICHCSRLWQYPIFIKLLGSVRLTKWSFFPQWISVIPVSILNQTQNIHFKRMKNLWHAINVQMRIWMNQTLTTEKATYVHQLMIIIFGFRPKSVTSSGNRWKSYLPIKRLQVHLE